ncbi:MAG: polysaccharide deacetylase family protein, partial [Candidatus Cloacimonetes bacterium]|nr:polysaccharide deacetylase family protein [Candidatus Cloacimonadota bacterium]
MIIKPAFFTIDIEDYYHIIGVRGTPDITSWDQLPSRVEYSLDRLLDLLAEHNVTASLFFLGYIAKRYPHLVKKAMSQGHEIASHGMYHTEVCTQSQSDFFAEALQSRMLLEDICGEAVIGYRGAGFSIDHRNPWFFESLLQAGYLYDSSLVPNRLHHRLIPGVQLYPSKIQTNSGSICEFPIGMAEMAGMKLNMFGGGYLRFFPKPLLIHMAHRTLMKRPLLVYIHPREMDPDHPRISMNL